MKGARGMWAVVAVGCARAVDDEQPCDEARVAMAARLEACTGDPERALELLEAAEAAECAWPDAPAFDTGGTAVLTGVYECAFAARHLPCELAVDYGTDVSAWLTVAPVCAALLVLP